MNLYAVCVTDSCAKYMFIDMPDTVSSISGNAALSGLGWREVTASDPTSTIHWPLFSQPVCPPHAWCPPRPRTSHPTLQQRAPMDRSRTMLPPATYRCPERKHRKAFASPRSRLWCQAMRSPTTLWNERWGRTWKPLVLIVCCSREISLRF